MECCCCRKSGQDFAAGDRRRCVDIMKRVIELPLQLSDDWEPTQGWDVDVLAAVGGGKGGLEGEWVLQVCAKCEV